MDSGPGCDGCEVIEMIGLGWVWIDGMDIMLYTACIIGY